MSANRLKRRASGSSVCTVSAAVLSIFLVGCQSGLPRSRAAVRPIPSGNAALMHYIADMPLVTAEAAYRGVYLIAEGNAYEGEYEALRDELVDRGIVGSTWKHHHDTLMNRAGVAYMVCKSCDIKRGLNWRLIGAGRYAWRELQHMGVGGRGSELGNLSGGEFLGILSRADKYLMDKRKREGVEPADKPAELGDEPEPRRTNPSRDP